MAYREGRTSPPEAVEQILGLIASLDPKLHAYITLDGEGALRTAREAEARFREGRPLGPLDGIPLAYKDLCFILGLPTTCGSLVYRDFEPRAECTAVHRLRAAGVVTLGKLNMAEFALGPTGHNMHFGDVQNPWKSGHIAGGSSSGSGAAVAAGLALGALGSDTGGSIRLPSAFCGVVGLKPTWGRVSRVGAMPLSWSMDCLGPMTRTAEDNALIMQTIAGYDPADATTSRLPVPDYLSEMQKGAEGLRVGLPENFFFDAVSEETERAVREAIGVLEKLGADIVPVKLPAPEVLDALTNLITKCEAASIHGQVARERPGEITPQVLARMETGFHIPAHEYLDALRLRARLVKKYGEEVFSKVDALAAPAVPFSAPTLEETGVGAGEEMSEMITRLTRFTRMVSGLGAPAMSLPCGFSSGGLPLALQLIGAPFREDILYRLAYAYECETGGQS